MIIIPHRRSHAGVIAIIFQVTVRAFHDIPAVVFTTITAGGLKIDLFPAVIADISQVQVARLGIEGKAPGITQAESPDLPSLARYVDKRIVGRDDVSAGLRNANRIFEG